MNKLILWDFDGVIVPSWEASFEVNKMYTPDLTPEKHKEYFEGNIHSHPINDTIDEIEFDFWKEYIPKVHTLSFYEGIDLAIKDLCNKYKAVIVSSGAHRMIDEYLSKHNLRHYFKDIYGFEVHTSKIEKIAMAFADHNSDADNSVFITDTLGDIREAEAHNMNTIAVTWGFHPRETLEKGKPDVILDSPQKLVEAVEKLIK